MTHVDESRRRNDGGGERFPATVAINLELLMPGKPADDGSKCRQDAADQGEPHLHRDHPFVVSQNGPGPGNSASI
jgi:hypothetical protein